MMNKDEILQRVFETQSEKMKRRWREGFYDPSKLGPKPLEGNQIIERFWSKVDRNGPIHPVLGTPCWLWTAGQFSDGYGGYRGQRAHRFAYKLNHEDPGDLDVCHHCDTPLCVNNEGHLFAGTNQDNVDDCWKKGRQGGQFKKGSDPRRTDSKRCSICRSTTHTRPRCPDDMKITSTIKESS